MTTKLNSKKIGVVALAVSLVCIGWVNSDLAAENTIAASNSPYPPLHLTSSTHTQAQIKRGEYMVKMADCFTCHTNEAEGGKAFAGGLKIKTPFGSLYAPNITPDKETGIGSWSDEQFLQAVRQGIAPNGSYYYPVFPYNYFNKMSQQDVLDIKAYLDAIPAVKQANHAQEMQWPFNYRFLQWGWRLLFFDFSAGEFKPHSSHSEVWNRGAFIVEGPGHCALCHSRLNYFGVPQKKHYLAGAFIEDYYAPNITSQGLNRLAATEVADIFLHNEMPTHAELGGPMKDVEHNSLRFLSHDDMIAIANYLKSIKSEAPPIEVTIKKTFSQLDGKKLYQSSCAMCHNNHLMGAPSMNKHVWNVLRDQGRDKLYEVAIRGSGDMPAKGGCDACSNGRIKAAVNYMIFLADKNRVEHIDTPH